MNPRLAQRQLKHLARQSVPFHISMAMGSERRHFAGVISIRTSLVIAAGMLAFVAAWVVATTYFPETMRSARTILMLFTFGGPDG